ncbi:MAG: hypothetical protein GWN86_07015 [Desulfobacterales bacterium]|nr:hypothetical protein [Desulfobacterales bacterium]
MVNRNSKGQITKGSAGRLAVKGFKTAAQWALEGVTVFKSSGDLPREERETNISFINSQKDAEVDTCEQRWMRRLEADGAIPQSIHVYSVGDGEHRSYIIPKAWVKMPYKTKRSTS